MVGYFWDPLLGQRVSAGHGINSGSTKKREWGDDSGGRPVNSENRKRGIGLYLLSELSACFHIELMKDTYRSDILETWR